MIYTFSLVHEANLFIILLMFARVHIPLCSWNSTLLTYMVHFLIWSVPSPFFRSKIRNHAYLEQLILLQDGCDKKTLDQTYGSVYAVQHEIEENTGSVM
jgi:hypothetical protein